MSAAISRRAYFLGLAALHQACADATWQDPEKLESLKEATTAWERIEWREDE